MVNVITRLALYVLCCRVTEKIYILRITFTFPSCFRRLLNTFLPAFRRQYEVLQQAGLADAVVESDFQELKHLVQREKAVVWADQTIVEDPNKTDLPDITSILSFPHLSYAKTTPCRKICSTLLIC